MLDRQKLTKVRFVFSLKNQLSESTRVVFTREKFLHFVCSLPHGNHSDSNNPLTQMHTLTHIGHLKYNVQKSMKSSIKFNLIFLVIVFVLNHLNLAQIMVFFCHLCHKIDQKCKISAKLDWFNTNILARNITLNLKVDIHWISNVVCILGGQCGPTCAF